MRSSRSPRASEFSTPWFNVVAQPASDGSPYYMLELDDYVSVVAVTAEQQVLLVRQHRPVVDGYTVEFPSGHVDPGETPEEAMRRELLEETGFVAGKMDLLGTLVPDVGRLANRMWCYFAADVRPSEAAPPPEKGLTLLTVPSDAVIRLAVDGTMNHALNLAVLFLAVAHRKLTLGSGSLEDPLHP